MRDVITAEQFEAARLAFIEAWEARNDVGPYVDGDRTTAGMTAALATLGLTVGESDPTLADRTAMSVRVYWETRDWSAARFRTALVEERLR